jgi:alpha-tubulin suppressor-like RCC1 family protein
MTITNSTFRFFLEKLGDEVASTFVGHEGDIFYDPNTGILRLSDGNTPGGVPITQGATSIAFDPTNYYTRAAVDGLFANLLGTADAQGDTLGELQALIASALPLSGGTMTGPIYYAPLPIGVSELTNKGYVDSKIAAELATALGSLTTSLVPEGTNLYYTEARATANFTVNIADPMKTIGLVRTVNGVSPDTTGAISLSLTTTETGDFASRPATSNNGTLYVVSGDANTDLNGDAYIWTGNTTSGTWEVVAPSDTATNDARYVQLSGSTMQGPLIAAADPVANLEFATKQYVDNQPLGMHGDVDLTSTPPVAGQALTYNGTDWVPATPAAKLGDLLDVSNTTPGTGFVLGWDVANSEWMPVASAAAPTLASLLDTDVVGLNAPAEGSTLVYNANTAMWETLPAATTLTPLLPAGGHGWGRFHAYGNQLFRAGSSSAERIHAWGEPSDTYVSKPIGVNVEVSGWKKIWDGISYEYALSEEGWLFTAGDDDLGQQATNTWSSRPVNDSHANFIRNESPEIFGPGIEIIDFWSHYKTRNESTGWSGSLWVHVNDNGTPKTYAAGYNYSGVLGRGAGVTANQGSLGEIAELNGKNVVSLHCHTDTMMLVTDTGEVWGAGYNGEGALGIGTNTSSNPILSQAKQAFTFGTLVTPVPITNAKDAVVEFVTGIGVTNFILLNDGRVLSAGTNHRGSLGNGATSGSNRLLFDEVLTAAGTPITDIQRIWGAGRGQLFMMNSAGEVWATGSNHDGVWGNPAYPEYTGNPYAVKIQENVEDLWFSGGNRAGWCTAHWLKTDGTMWASGSDTDYMLGNQDDTNSARMNELVPFSLPNGEKIAQHVQIGGITDSDSGYIGVAVVSNAGNHYIWGQNVLPGCMNGFKDHIKWPALLNDYLPASTEIIRKEIINYVPSETAEFSTVGLSAANNTLAGNSTVPLDVVIDSNGIPFDVATSTWSLKGGSSYKLEASIYADNFAANTSYVTYRFSDTAGNSVCGNLRGAATAEGSTVPLTAVFTPTVDTDIRLSIATTSGVGTFRIRDEFVSATVTKIAANTPTTIELNDVMDVDAATPSDGDALVFDSATSTWKPGAVASGSTLGVAAEYFTTKMTNQNYYSPLNGTFIWDTVGESVGMSYDTTTGFFTLKAGVTYELSAAIKHNNIDGYSRHAFVEVDNGNAIIGTSGLAESLFRNTAFGQQPLAYAIYTPTVDTRVALRGFEAFNGWVHAEGSFMSVKAIANQLPITTKFEDASNSYLLPNNDAVYSLEPGAQMTYLDGVWQPNAVQATADAGVVFGNPWGEIALFMTTGGNRNFNIQNVSGATKFIFVRDWNKLLGINGVQQSYVWDITTFAAGATTSLWGDGSLNMGLAGSGEQAIIIVADDEAAYRAGQYREYHFRGVVGTGYLNNHFSLKRMR